MKPEILAKAEVLEKSATPTTHDNSDSVDKSTKGGAEVSNIFFTSTRQLINIVTRHLKYPNLR
jgi:hypothetical protein